MNGLLAFIKGKCPQCRQGNVFKYPFLKITRFREMHTHCSNCEVKYESETGFFWGAMYFSYALNVASIVVIGFFFFAFSDDVNIGVFVGTVLAFTLLTFPMLYRVSRLLMMYVAAPYRRYRKELNQPK